LALIATTTEIAEISTAATPSIASTASERPPRAFFGFCSKARTHKFDIFHSKTQFSPEYSLAKIARTRCRTLTYYTFAFAAKG
jgi:hypothetical protein